MHNAIQRDNKKEKVMKTYNGWTNRDTWAMHLNFTNTPIIEKLYRSCKTQRDLLDIFEIIFECNCDGIVIENVDFEEILNFLEKERQ